MFRWAVGIAAGVSLFFTFGVALRLFKILPHSVAGSINVQLFPGYYVFLTASLLIALFASLPLFKMQTLNKIATFLVLTALICVLVNAHILGPKIMEAMKPATMDTFRRLHGISMGLNMLSILTILAAPLCLREK